VVIHFRWDTILEDIGTLNTDASFQEYNNIFQLDVNSRTTFGRFRKITQTGNIEGLVSVFRSKATSQWVFDNDNHNSYVIFAVGRGSLLLKNERAELPRYFFISPFFPKITAEFTPNQQVALVIICVQKATLTDLTHLKQMAESIIESPHYLTAEMETIIKKLSDFEVNFISAIEAQKNINQLFLSVFTNHESHHIESKISPESFKKVQKVVEILSSNYSSNEKPSIQKLATAMNVSPSKLKNDFRIVYNDSVYNYYLKRKLSYAAELLASQKYTVSQVAIKVGYHGQATKFVQIFRKYYGMTPKQYQIRNRKITNQET
jgi:AraC-like DNA-binding protein